MAQLKARRVKKTYLALVLGEVSAEVGRIEAPIGRDPKHRTKMAVVPDGRPSVTGYRVRERLADPGPGPIEGGRQHELGQPPVHPGHAERAWRDSRLLRIGVGVHHAGLNPGAAVGSVYLQDAVHAGHADDDGATECQ